MWVNAKRFCVFYKSTILPFTRFRNEQFAKVKENKSVKSDEMKECGELIVIVSFQQFSLLIDR